MDAQPLVVPGVLITAGSYQGTHDVVYVATENNTVYAIDVHTGTVLLKSEFWKASGRIRWDAGTTARMWGSPRRR